MKKGVISLALCLSLGLSPLCAVESAYKKNAHNMQQTALSSADKEFLFAANANHLNVVTLSDEEMAETEGEEIVTALVIGAASGAGFELGRQAVKKIKKWFRW